MWSQPSANGQPNAKNLAKNEDNYFHSPSGSLDAITHGTAGDIACDTYSSADVNLFFGSSTVNGLGHDSIARADTLNVDTGTIDGDLPSHIMAPGFHDSSIANVDAFSFTYTPNTDSSDSDGLGLINSTNSNMEEAFNSATWAGIESTLSFGSFMEGPMGVSPTEKEDMVSAAASFLPEIAGPIAGLSDGLGRGIRWTPAMNESILKHKRNGVKYGDIVTNMKAEFGVSLNNNILCKRFKILAKLALRDNVSQQTCLSPRLT
jgi:hypothetical protein